MAEDVLGITGIVNIDDIQKTFDALIGDLDRLGVETEQISSRMTKALTDIANSSEKDLAAKTKAAMQVLNDAIAETNKQLQHTPETLKNAEQEASRLQSAVAKLEKELSGTVVGSKEFNALQKQLQSERETLRLQTADVQDMKAANEHAAQSVQHLQDIYETFVSQLQQQGTATQETTQATDAQAEATERATRATQEQTKAEKEHAGTQKDVQAAIEDTQNTIDELVAKQEKAQKRMAKLKEDMQQWAASGIEKGYIKQTGEGRYKADPKAAGYNKNVIAQMQRIAKEYNELKDSLREYRDEEILAREGLAELKQSLQEVEQHTQQATQATEDAKTKSPRQMLMELRNEITLLTLQYRDMTDAEKASAEGQALQKKLDELQAKAAKLQDAFSDVQETIKHDASDTAAFAGLTQGLNLVISGFGAAEGAAAAFGMSEEDLARAQTIIQGSLAATNFLTETSNALQGQSALMRGINTLQTWASAKAIDIETAAKGRNIIATKAATVAQGIFNAIAKANPYVLLATAIITVVGALAAFAIGSKKAKKEEEELQRAQEREKDFYDTYHSTLATTIDKYRELESAYKKLKSAKEKTKWIKDNKDEFHKLGIELKGIEETERVFAGNTDEVIRAFDLRARAAAYAAKITKLYNDALTGQTHKVGDKLSESEFLELFPDQHASSDGHIYSRYAHLVGGLISDDLYLTQEGVDELNERALDQAEKEATRLRELKDELNEQAAKILESMGASTYDPNNNEPTDKPEKPTKDKPQYKSAAELNDELLKLTQERVERELAAEKEGTKRWEQLMRERIALQAEADRRAVQKASDEAVADLDASYKGGKSGLNEQQYTERRAQLQQQAADAIVAINAKQNADIAAIEQERQRAELASMLDYLKQYGSIQQQKYAIAKEYDEKIAKEQDEYRRKALEAEKQSRLAQMNAQNLAQNINWGQMFSGVGNVLQGIAQETLKKVSDYMKTDEYKKLSPTDKKTYQDLRTQLVDAGGISASNPFSGQVWKEIGDAAQRYRNSVLKLNKANERAEQIREQLTQAEQAAASTPTDKGLQDNVAQLRKQLDEAGTAVNDAQTEYVESQEDLRTKTESVAKGFNNFNTILGQITSGSLSGFATAVGNIIKKISGSNDEVATNFGELFGEAGKQIGGLVGAILQIIDILGTEPAKFIDDLLTKVADVLEAVLSQLPEIIASAIKGVGNIVGSIFTGLAEGVASLFGGGADNSAYENALDKWGHILETWEENLKYEKQLMEKAYGGDLLNLQKETMQGLKNAQAAAAEIYRGWAGSGAGWFSHSNGYNVNEDTDWGALVANNPDIARQVGVQSYNFWGRTFYDGGSVDNLFNLDWRELEKLKYSNTKFWQSLHGEAQKYLEQFIEAGKAMDEVQKATWEKLTTTTSDNVFDGFLNSLYELANKSEDVFNDIADNWQEMVNKMVINNLIGKNFQSQIESWYEKLAKLNERRNKGEITNEQYQRELENLRQEYEGYVKKAQQEIEDYRNAGIISVVGGESQYEQSASSKAWQTMSQDTADELNGRFTALYESNLRILDYAVQNNELLVLVQADISQTRLAVVTLSQNMTELLDVQYDNLNKLDEIIANTAPLPDMAAVVEKIYNAVKNVNKK